MQPFAGRRDSRCRAHLIHFDYNNIASLEEAADLAGDDLGGILVSAFKHDIGKPQELPTEAFAQRARSLADRQDAALIVDDVKAGFRLDIGGSWKRKASAPILSAWSKAIANGHALAAVTGNNRFRDGATKIFTTGSFWTAAVPMAAAIATIAKLARTGAIAHMRAMGERLRAGLAAQALRHGLPLRQSGPPQMPVFALRPRREPPPRQYLLLGRHWNAASISTRPSTMFLSAAHHEDDIDAALAATDDAMAAMV